MNRSRSQRAAREVLSEELDAVLKQLQAVRAAARDPKGESLGVSSWCSSARRKSSYGHS